MRTIPPVMQAAFIEQQGLNVFLVVEIDWAGVETVQYSTREFVDQTIYPYIQSYSDFESVSHVEGLGSVSSIQIDFVDQFGHFKEKIDTLDFFTGTTATVYLTLDGIELFDLFAGTLSTEFTYSNNIFSVNISSDPLEKEIGYEPDIEDVDQELEDPTYYGILSRHLNTTAWPSIFGTVKNYLAPILFPQRFAETQEEVFYEPGIDPAYYDLPVDQVEDFTLDSDYTVNIVGKQREAFSIIGTGQFKIVDDVKLFRLNKLGVTSIWYKNIAFTFLDPTGIAGYSEFPKTRLLIDPGTVVLSSETLNTLGPDGNPTSDVWLQFMKIEIRYTLTVGETTVTNSKHVNCIKQETSGTDFILTLNENIELPDGVTDVYIRNVYKANDFIFSIPANSQIYVFGDQLVYIVDTKEGTTVDAVRMKNGEELITFDPGLYTVLSTPLWEGTHSPVTYIKMAAELYMRFTEHYAVKDKEGEGILVSAHNSLVTDQQVVAYLSELTTEDANPKTTDFAFLEIEDVQNIIPEIAWQTNKAVRFSRSGGSDILQLIDLTDYTEEPAHIFKESNVLKNSITYSISEKDKLYTVFNADFQTNDYLKELQTIKYSKNVDKYKEVLLDVDYYVFKNKSDARTSFTYWRDKLSQYYYTIKLVGFMDAFHLEVWDRVGIELDTNLYYDPATGTPFTNTHTSTPNRWHAAGRVKTISPDLKEGTVEFFIELDSIFGLTTDTPYIRI